MSLFNECIFCDEEIEGILWWSTTWYARINTNPVSSGHVLVIPTRHVQSLNELVDEEKKKLPRAVDMAQYLVESIDWKRMYTDALEWVPKSEVPFLESALASKFLKVKPEGYDLCVHEEIVTNQNRSHVYIHVIPRYEGAVVKPIDGARSIVLDEECS